MPTDDHCLSGKQTTGPCVVMARGWSGGAESPADSRFPRRREVSATHRCTQYHTAYAPATRRLGLVLHLLLGPEGTRGQTLLRRKAFVPVRGREAGANAIGARSEGEGAKPTARVTGGQE